MTTSASMSLTWRTLLVAWLAHGVFSSVYYVSPTGSDTLCDGLAPNASALVAGSCAFATLYRAQIATRAGRCAAVPCSVFVRAGTYVMSVPLTITPLDSGVVWQKYPSDAGSAVLSGGVSLTSSAWTLVPASGSSPAMWSTTLPAQFNASNRPRSCS